MSGEEFRINVGADVDVSDIKSKINGIKIDDIKLKLDTSDAESKIKSLKTQIKGLSDTKINLNIGTGSKGNSGVAAQTVSGLDTAYRKLKTISKNIGSLEIKLTGLDSTKNINQIKTLESQLQSLTGQYHKCVEKIKNAGDLSPKQWQLIQQQIDATGVKIEQLQAKAADLKSKFASGIIDNFNSGTFENNFDKIRTFFDNIKEKSSKAVMAFDSFENAYKELQSAIKSGDNDAIISSNERFLSSLKEIENQLKINARAEKQAASTRKLDLDKQAFSSSIDAWSRDNSAALKQFGAQIDDIRYRLQSCDATELSNLRTEFTDIKNQAKAAGVATQTFGDGLKTQFQRLGSYMTASLGIMEVIQLLRSMFNNVLEVDTAMTELYRVTDLTASQYDNLYDNMVGSAKKYGSTLTDIIGATADWSRAGFDPGTANGLAEVTTMYQHISDLDYNTAVENLLTAYKGFEGELTNMFGDDTVAAVGYIGDILNELDNNYAVTAAGVGEAMKRSASALDVAGNSIQETAGMVTGITEVTQDPEKAGNALKVVSMRLRGKLLCLRTRKVCTLCYALNSKNIEDSYIRQSARVA